ncbi:MAG TPA: flippase [Polyangiaceae bacterium]
MNSTSSTTESQVAPPAKDWRRKEIGLAFGNAVRLGSSLILTWGIALVTRLYVPRYLGPERFGILNFAEAFTATAFVFMGLGLDTYVRKELSVRPEHASDFIGGVIAIRSILLVGVFAAMHIVLAATHRPVDVIWIVYIYGLAQFFTVGSATSAGILQAAGKVRGQSILSVVVKLLWAACTFLAVYFRLGLWAFALTFMLSEGVKSLAFFWLAKRELRFETRVDLKGTGRVLLASLPFFVSGLATTIYDKIGVNLLAFMTNNREVGWLGAANGLAGITMLLTPVVSWVLIPLMARSYAICADEFYKIVRRTMELIVGLATPVSLMMALGADVWVKLFFGAQFAPSAMSLRVIAISTALMYLTMLLFYALAVLNYTWRITFAFVGGVIINPTCLLLIMKPLITRIGPGGGGVACAIATLVTEIGIILSLIALLGKRGFDRRLVFAFGKFAGSVLAVVALHTLVLGGCGPWRLVVDAIAYVGLMFATRAVNIPELIKAAKVILESRRAKLAS